MASTSSNSPDGHTMATRRRRILFLDAFDSFSNNITSLLTTLLDVDVYVLPISPDLGHEVFAAEAARYDAVVCGPGPGNPECERDVGMMGYVWELERYLRVTVPVLGVCLGFQSLVTKFAGPGTVRRLRRGLHGMVREVEHVGEDVFKGVGRFEATLYHSLGVAIEGGLDDETEWPGLGEELEALAWVEEERGEGEMETILMAVRHRTKPFWGLQYHPESVCTTGHADTVIENWFEMALRWNMEHGRTVDGWWAQSAKKATRHSLLSRVQRRQRRRSEHELYWEEERELCESDVFVSSTIPLPTHVQVPDIVEMLDGHEPEHIVLDSANARLPAPTEKAADVRGRYSIIALELSRALRLEYQAGDSCVELGFGPLDHARAEAMIDRVKLRKYGGIWNFLAEFQRKRRVEPKEGVETPFIGGFMGFVTYEQGLADIGLEVKTVPDHDPFRWDRGSVRPDGDRGRPDVSMAWVTKSVVLDHQKGLLHIQHIQGGPDDDDAWVHRIKRKLRHSPVWKEPAFNHDVWYQTEGIIQSLLSTEYQGKVKRCQEHIAAGDSYELCLTDQTTIKRPRSLSSTTARNGSKVIHAWSSKERTLRPSPTKQGPLPSSWQLFRKLRTRQPAPFASYIRLGTATLVSASPERFLTYDTEGHVSMRPMKGTVRKSEAVSTLAQAEAILHVPKEEAENLMIVDLVRHDLHGVCGAGNVDVKELMKVEEYQSVFQMITVVEGQLPPSDKTIWMDVGYTGLDVLAASLPPGSMTGAPKKRSCEILKEIEGGQERGLYSGVVGYMCASGRGDWSVTIRSLFRWDDEGDEGEEVWRIGAGGAVTILSTPEGEAEEMFTKLAGPLSVFKAPEKN